MIGIFIITLMALTTGAILGIAASWFGIEKPVLYAFIREAECIGCTLCIKACPVDAIAGAAKLMHTVIHDHCTGCELCIPPCPVDCIDLIPAVTRPTGLSL